MRWSVAVAVVVVCSTSLVEGCILGNPGFDESESGDPSVTATATAVTLTGPSGGTSATVTSQGSESSGVSDSGATEPTTVGPSTSTADATESGTTGAATTEASTGESEGSSSTGEMPDLSPCPKEEVVKVQLEPTENTYVVTSNGKLCTWTDSNLKQVNPTKPCDILNFGDEMAKYTLIGRSGDSRGEYLVRFGVHEAMLDYPDMGIAHVELVIVPWWSMNRSNVQFTVGVVDYADAWVPGDKAAQPADKFDSNWMYREISGLNVELLWSSGDGPAAGSVDAGTITLDELSGGEHPVVTSSPIKPSLLKPWVGDAGKEQGFVLHTDIAPILVKNKDTDYQPLLRLQLCPL